MGLAIAGVEVVTKMVIETKP